MASNFELSMTRRGGILSLVLKGDLDSDSVAQLIEALQRNHEGVAMARIETDGLAAVDPSGKDSLQKRIRSLGDFCYRLVFTGQYASQLRPAWAEWF